MGGATVTELRVFPVKSARGMACDGVTVEPWGFAGDRRWMVVDAAWRFMTQREHPAMARLQALVEADGLVLACEGGGRLAVAAHAAGGACRVTVWQDRVAAMDCGEEAARWLSGVLGTPCRLVRMDDPTARPLRPAYAAGPHEAVSFADGFPVLLAGEASLAAVNANLAVAVPMLRFRANLVVSGAAAWEEDGWRRVRIGAVVFRVAKACERCIMTTIDPQTGLRPQGNEPLRSMAQFRRDAAGRIMFGQNLVPETVGEIRLGDGVTVLEAGASHAGLGRIGWDEAVPAKPPGFP